MNTPSILQKIIKSKQTHVAHAKSKVALHTLKTQVQSHQPRGFARALLTKNQRGDIGIISEVKRASPSKGIICANFNPVASAVGYQQAGATCLSVLTDVAYFGGADDHLVQVKNATTLPILRKDFMIDEYQIVESAGLGADCVLLIMACLDDQTLARLHACALEYGLDVLIEIHSQDELERALALPLSEHNIYGINNRNLNTFTVDLQNSIGLADRLRQKLGENALIVSESGIHSASDIHLLQRHSIHNFLIGEQFMKTDNAGKALAKLLDEV